MPTFTTSFISGLALVAAVLATPAAQAQSTSFTSVALSSAEPLVASIQPVEAASMATAAAESVQKLSAPIDLAEQAVYYDDSHKDLKQALAWMQETNALHAEYWSVYAEARIRLQLKDYVGALATAEQAKKLALAATPPNDEYARRSAEVATKAQGRVK